MSPANPRERENRQRREGAAGSLHPQPACGARRGGMTEGGSVFPANPREDMETLENREKNIERLEDDELNLVLIDGDTKQVGPHRKIANALQSDMSARRNRVEGGLSLAASKSEEREGQTLQFGNTDTWTALAR